jgi:hypothetical protein
VQTARGFVALLRRFGLSWCGAPAARQRHGPQADVEGEIVGEFVHAAAREAGGGARLERGGGERAQAALDLVEQRVIRAG